MALDQTIIGELAARLHEAERSRTQIGQFSLEYPQITLDDGYAVSRTWVRHKLSEGRRVIGHKIGLTSRAMQRSSNVNEPDFGTLLDDMLFMDGSDIPIERFIEPRVEVELAFILKSDLEGQDCTLFDVLNATEYVTPAIEIIDARICRIDSETKATRKVFDTISDNAANAGVVLGGRPVRPNAVDLTRVAALLYRNALIEESGVAGAVLNHPANGVAWLTRKLAPFGERLERGQIVLAGSFTAPIFASHGDVFRADYGDLGNISVRFV